MEISSDALKRKNPENVRERTHKFVIEHKSISTIGFLVISWLFFRFFPLSWLDLIPFVSSKIAVLLLIANLFAFFPSRWLYKKFRGMPVDFIIQAGVGEQEDGKKLDIGVYQYYKGKFLEDYDFKGRPLSWNNPQGRTVYLVRNVDKAEKTAECSEFGELSDLEQIQAIQKIRDNRFQKHKYARAGIKVLSKVNTLIDKWEASYIGNLEREEIRKTKFNADEILQDIEKEIPEMGETDESGDKTAQEILEDIEDLGGDLDASVNLSPSSKGEKGE